MIDRPIDQGMDKGGAFFSLLILQLARLCAYLFVFVCMYIPVLVPVTLLLVLHCVVTTGIDSRGGETTTFNNFQQQQQQQQRLRY